MGPSPPDRRYWHIKLSPKLTYLSVTLLVFGRLRPEPTTWLPIASTSFMQLRKSVASCPSQRTWPWGR